jgi:dimethylargininase
MMVCRSSLVAFGPLIVRVFDFNSAIVRTPGFSVVNGLRAHSGPAPDFAALQAEHTSYITALQAAGMAVTVLPALEPFPDSVFVEDPALVFSPAAILLRPGAPSRLAETEELLPSLAARFPEVLRVSEGYADGGDILVTPGRVYIGLSARTNETGAAALRELLASIGLASQVVDTPRDTLHLKSDCSLIDEDAVLATRELANSGILDGFRTFVVPQEERAATNALRVNDVVFVRADCPRTQDMLVKHGLEIVPLPVTQIARIDAGLSCMSLRWFDQAAKARDRARHSASAA